MNDVLVVSRCKLIGSLASYDATYPNNVSPFSLDVSDASTRILGGEREGESKSIGTSHRVTQWGRADRFSPFSRGIAKEIFFRKEFPVFLKSKTP